MKSRVTLTVLAVFQIPLFAGDDPDTPRFARRWVYTYPSFDLRHDDQTDAMIDLVRRVGAAGYNGINVQTGRLMVFRVPPTKQHLANIERVRQAAEDAGVEPIPVAMQINGYSSWALSNNPNLAEGMPVRDCVFQVKDGKATVAQSENRLPFGDFEKFSEPNRPDGWAAVDGPGVVAFEDREVRHSGEASLRFQDFTKIRHGNGRVEQRFSDLKPWHQYHCSVWIKTENVKSPAMIWVRAQGDKGERQRYGLHRAYFRIPRTRDWQQYHAVFNTQECTDVRLS